jgi:hypothetical protein
MDLHPVATPLQRSHPRTPGAWHTVAFWLRNTLAAPRPAVVRHTLGANTVLRLEPGRTGLSFASVQGTVSVTQEGDFEDHVLTPGERFETAPHGLVVVWALSDAEVSVGPARSCAAGAGAARASGA